MGRGLLDKPEWEEVCKVEAKERVVFEPWVAPRAVPPRAEETEATDKPGPCPAAPSSLSFLLCQGRGVARVPTPQSRCQARSGGQPEPPRKHLHIPDAYGQQWRRAPGPSPAPHPALAATLETGLGGEWAPEGPPADVT